MHIIVFPDDEIDKMCNMGSDDDEKVTEMVDKCGILRKELKEVVAELDAPKVSDSPESCEN